ncbi:ester cyclase [Streptomyces sp. NPDC060064]|uniref:ester cyclase n=1 Tax=Streptomyces sp. NPDC060064 TaxID=3347049 RepID=UPI0036CF3125
MLNRRSVIRSGSAAIGAIALSAVASGTDLAAAAAQNPHLFGDPAQTPVPDQPYPRHLTRCEREHLERFDELDYVVYSGQEWSRIEESHAPNVRVHFPDGRYVDGLDEHIADLKSQFVWAPDTHISEHPIRIAKGELTAVTAVMRGTFTRPMPDGKGGFTQPTGKKFAINMITVGIWNRHGVMDEEFLFWDDRTFGQQLGLS